MNKSFFLYCIIAAFCFAGCEQDMEDNICTSDKANVVVANESVVKGLFPATVKIPKGVGVRDNNGDYWEITGTVTIDKCSKFPFVQITHCDITMTNTRTGERRHFYGVPKQDDSGSIVDFSGEITNEKGEKVDFATCSVLFNTANNYILNNFESWL